VKYESLPVAGMFFCSFNLTKVLEYDGMSLKNSSSADFFVNDIGTVLSSNQADMAASHYFIVPNRAKVGIPLLPLVTERYLKINK
jgi:hypothetical protein